MGKRTTYFCDNPDCGREVVFVELTGCCVCGKHFCHTCIDEYEIHGEEYNKCIKCATIELAGAKKVSVEITKNDVNLLEQMIDAVDAADKYVERVLLSKLRAAIKKLKEE